MSFYIKGVEIKLEFGFFFVLSVFLLADRTGLGALMVLCSLLHECGHFVLMLLFGVRFLSVTFSPFGINITRERLGGPTGAQEALIYAAGPLVNLLLALGVHRLSLHKYFADAFVAINLIMAAFNLLPVGCLDGGNMLRALLERRLGLRELERLSGAVSMLALLPLFGAAVYLLMHGGNFTLLATCVYLAAVVLFKKS